MIWIKAETSAGSRVTICTDGAVSFLTVYGDIRYYDWREGYIHLLPNHEYTPEEIGAIKAICIRHFADKLPEINTNLKVIDYRNIRVPLPVRQVLRSLLPSVTTRGLFGDRGWRHLRCSWRPAYTTTITVDCVAALQRLSLGGSWQRYFTDRSWLAEAEALKGSRVYLA
ncbi:MAG: hypothetical protein PHQ43_10740 [Dehalococcoidales bacterium]|nr:hypothetical protein [Dehalococcoidales bacterium]